MAQTSLGQTLAQTLLDLEDDLGWDQVKSSFSYKQRAWVNAVERLVASPDPELSELQELTLQLHTAVKLAALPAWFRLSLPRWKSAVSSAADTIALQEAIVILGAACRGEDSPSPKWKMEQPPAMPEDCVVVKTEVKVEVKQEVPAWPEEAFLEVQPKQEVEQEVEQEPREPLAPVVRQCAAGSSGKTKVQAAPHVRRRPETPGSAKRARTSSGDEPLQPVSAGAREEAAGAPGWEQEPLDEPDDEGGGGGAAGWLPDPMGVDSEGEGGAGPAGAGEDGAMTPERDASEAEDDEEEEDEDGDEDEESEEDEVSSEEDSDDGSAHVSDPDSEDDEGALTPTLTLIPTPTLTPTLTRVRRGCSGQARRRRLTRHVRAPRCADDSDDPENGQSDEEEEPSRGRRAPAARRRAARTEAPWKPGPSAVLSAAWMQGDDSEEEEEGAAAHASVASIESSEAP